MAKYKAGANRVGTIKYFGGDEIIQKLDKLGANVEEALTTALLKSAEPVKKELLDYMLNDTHTIKKKDGTTEMKTGHNVSWDTYKTFVSEVKEQDNKMYCYVGFNLRKEDGKPGLPALFLNYGTPNQDPSFFIDKAIDNNIDKIKKIQQETLEKIAKDLGL